MRLFTAVSAYSCHVWPFAATIADNTQTYCWHVYALNVGNMKTWQYCNIVPSKIKIYTNICDHFLPWVTLWLFPVQICYSRLYTKVKHNEYKKSTKTCVYDKIKKKISMRVIKTWKLGELHPSFRQCVFESYLNIKTKIDTPIFINYLRNLLCYGTKVLSSKIILTRFLPQFGLSSPCFYYLRLFSTKPQTKMHKI